jgi:methylated-DNA-[protein]-cysteine S-methyltransferase
MAKAEGFCLFPAALGECALAWSGGLLSAVHLPEASARRLRERMQSLLAGTPERLPPPFAARAIVRIQALLQGERDDLLDIPLDMEAVPRFHRRVYALTRAIPPGRTLTYGELAAQLGEPGAARAVGQALGANPFAPVVPCHRVLAAGGRSGGFSAEGGALTKLKLLEIERARFGQAPGLFD